MTHRHIELVAECDSEPDAIDFIQQHRPELILVDRERPVGNSHLAIRSRGRTLFVKVQEVDYIAAAHNNIVLHAGRARHVQRGSLAGIGEKLPREHFFRINKSIIVNLDRVREVRRPPRGQPIVVLQTGEEFPLTRQVGIGEIRRRLEFR